MKRTDITELFPEATKEQIDKLMNLNGADINETKKSGEEAKRQLADALAQLDAAKKASEGAPSVDDLTRAKEQAAELEKELTALKLKNQLRELREAVGKEKGVPPELLTGETEDDCKKQADGILAFAKPSAYPSLPDGGEARRVSGASTRDSFAAWAEKSL